MRVFVFFFKEKTANDMRISDGSSDVCSSDLTNPTIRTELVKTLGGRPKWSNDFSSHAARSDADPAASAAFCRGLQATSVPVPDASAVALINRLLAARLFDEAWAYYAAARPGSAQRQIGRASCRDRGCQYG